MPDMSARRGASGRRSGAVFGVPAMLDLLTRINDLGAPTQLVELPLELIQRSTA
jgi:hypothetical protein